MSHEALLRALPEGGKMWVRAGGRSLWPLVLDGDQLLVKRCSGASLERGDLAVVAWGSQPLVAHLVEQTEPLITVSLVGVRDALNAEALGRVIAIRRGRRRVDLPRLSSRLFSVLPAGARWLKRLPGARALVRRLRDHRNP